MIILKLKIDNLYLFDEFEMDFTYNKKLSNNPIEFEHLKNFENFKYRKVNIIMGANSSGKTTLGNVMMSLQNIITKKSIDSFFLSKIREKNKNAFIEFTFVLSDILYKYDLKFDINGIVEDQISRVDIKKKDSYNTAYKRLKKYESMMYEKPQMESVVLEKCNLKFGWYYSFAMITDKDNNSEDIDLEILKKVLIGFDCTIRDVEKISENSYNIWFRNKENIVIQDGKIVNPERISSGTYESIRLATILSKFSAERNYFIDENIVHSHTELEKGILNVMINKLVGNSQLFFTTHNMDILEMNLPLHSFQFLTNDQGIVNCKDICKLFNKNDRKLRTYIENDVFNTLPDSDFLMELLYE